MHLPSEILNREFVLEDKPVTEHLEDKPVTEHLEGKFQALTTHAVRVGNIGMLLPPDAVSELIETQPICRLPNTPAWFDGVTSVRGNMIPVFDLHELLGVESSGSDRKIIIVGSGEIAAAFWVDEMPRMVMVTSDDYMSGVPPLPQLLKDHSRGYFFKDENIWIDWNIPEFFQDLGSRL